MHVQVVSGSPNERCKMREKYRCKVCKQEMEPRSAFTDTTRKFARYHIINGQPCHGFFEELVLITDEDL